MSNATILNEKIKELLMENDDILQSVVSELNAWNTCLPELEYWENDENFFETFFDGRPMEAVRATFYGEYNYNDDYVKFNGLANLESTNDIVTDMHDCIDDIIESLLDNYLNIYLDPELDELLSTYEV